MEKQKVEQLTNLLDEAVQLLSNFEGGYSDHFFSASDFHSALADAVNQVKIGNYAHINSLCLWFAPSYDWDDFAGHEGEQLGNKIFTLLTDLKLRGSG